MLEQANVILNKMQQAAKKAGRDSSHVELMLVTKTVPTSRILEAYHRGFRLYGENKIQEAAQKWSDPGFEGLRPDFIGHLQTNKVKSCLDVCGRIQSVDRESLVVALDKELQKRGERREVFLQVNTSDEDSKFGVAVSEALNFARVVAKYPTLKVTGLMTLALFSSEESLVRPCFKKLKNISTQIQEAGLFGNEFKHLSMGMSSDFEIAIEEGATIVRVGTAIFGARQLPDSHYWPT